MKVERHVKITRGVTQSRLACAEVMASETWQLFLAGSRTRQGPSQSFQLKP
jgi:hypothetical protein